MKGKVGIIALAFFAVLAYGVYAHALLARFDLSLALALHHQTTLEGVTIAQWISVTGSPVARALIGLVVIIGALLRHERALAAGWIVSLGGGGLLDTILKQLIHRPRPPVAIMYVNATGTSFPSGHAMGAVIMYGMIIYTIRMHSRSCTLNAGTTALAVILVAAIGWSRLYLGVHYLSDVLAGYAAGTVWLMTCIASLSLVHDSRTRLESHPSVKRTGIGGGESNS